MKNYITSDKLRVELEVVFNQLEKYKNCNVELIKQRAEFIQQTIDTLVYHLDYLEDGLER